MSDYSTLRGKHVGERAEFNRRDRRPVGADNRILRFLRVQEDPREEKARAEERQGKGEEERRLSPSRGHRRSGKRPPGDSRVARTRAAIPPSRDLAG